MKILVCSVHFGAGHTAHLSAYQKMLNECGYDVALYLDKRYMKLFNNLSGKVFFDQSEAEKFHPDILWIYNPGLENINVIRKFKHMHVPIAYVLHEPFMGVRNLLKEGNNFGRASAAMVLNYWTCYKADKVILSSLNAQKSCSTYMKAAYQKSTLFPLIFPDELIQNRTRKYFSSIGTYANTHGTHYFLEFVKNSEHSNDILFQIITRSNIKEKLKNPVFQRMIKNGRLIVQQGRPLTEMEMNDAYRKSICTWNGYIKSAQSGVLANSFMQGTPVMATRLESFGEYIQDGYNGIFINNFEYDTILNAFLQIRENISVLSQNARNTFLQYFYYRNQELKFVKIIDEIMQ